MERERERQRQREGEREKDGEEERDTSGGPFKGYSHLGRVLQALA